jgi:TatD DNase family protein
MPLIDSHCHLDRFEDVDMVLERGRKNGVHGFLSISTNEKTFSHLLPIVERHEDVYGTVGLHPCDIGSMSEDALYPWLIEQSSHPKIVGIGETGLDALATSPAMADQERYFRHHIRAALACNLPLIVHTRNSDESFLSVMRDVRANWPGGNEVMGVLHCFTGSLECAKEVIHWGWKVSLSGIVTFKNAPDLHSMARELPLSSLLVETDAPWLAPQPYRGQRNEPAYIVETAAILAGFQNCSLEHVGRTTTQNVLDLFRKMPPMMGQTMDQSAELLAPDAAH